jgi:hypothetical protein
MLEAAVRGAAPGLALELLRYLLGVLAIGLHRATKDERKREKTQSAYAASFWRSLAMSNCTSSKKRSQPHSSVTLLLVRRGTQADALDIPNFQ